MKLRVLIVDDDPSVLQPFAAALAYEARKRGRADD
jgi:hypothetical protein